MGALRGPARPARGQECTIDSITKLYRRSRSALARSSDEHHVGPEAEGGTLLTNLPRGGDLRAITVLGAFQAGVALANLVRVKVVALETGPAGLGLLTLVEQIVLLVALAFTLSLPFAAVKFLSLAHSHSRRSFARAYIGFRRLLTGLSLLGLVVALLIAFTVPGVLGVEIGANQQVLLSAIAGIPLLNLLALLVRALAASGRFRSAAAVTLAQAVGLMVGATAGVIAAGLKGYVVGGAVGLFVVLLAGTAYLRYTEGTGNHGGRIRTIPELRQYDGVVRFALVHSVIMLSTPAAFLFARYAVLRQADRKIPGVG